MVHPHARGRAPRGAKFSVVLALLLAVPALPLTLHAQERVQHANFQLAEKYSSAFLRQFTYSTSVAPHWIGDTDRFWYQYRTSMGTRYWLVDPTARTKAPLFDHDEMAALLSEACKKALDVANLDLRNLTVTDDGKKMTFVAENTRYEYTFETKALVDKGRPPARPTGAPAGSDDERRQEFLRRRGEGGGPPTGGAPGSRDHRVFAPDKKSYVFAKGHDLFWIEGTEVEKPVATAADGSAEPTEATATKEREGTGDTTGKTVDSAKQDDGKSTESGKQDAGKTIDSAKQDAGKTTDSAKQDNGKTTDSGKQDAGKSTDSGKQDNGKTTDSGKQDDGKTTDSGKQDAGKTVDSGKQDAGKTVDSAKQDNGKTIDSGKQETGKDEGAADGEAAAKEAEAPKGPEYAFDEQKARQLSDNGEEKYTFAGGGRGGGGRDQEQQRQREQEQEQEQERQDTQRQDNERQDNERQQTERQDGQRTERGRAVDAASRREAETPASERKSRPSATWSKDSAAFYVTRRDSRGVNELFLVNTLAEPRPALVKYDYPMPGEEAVRKTELHWFAPGGGGGKLERVAPKWKDESYSDVHFLEEGHELRFLRRDRLVRNAELCALDPMTGKVRVLIEESTTDANLITQNLRYVKGKGRMIWWSERSGWGHYYLHDTEGKLLNPITKGAFRASSIVDLDEDKGILWFRANAREPGETVYYEHLYKVHLDGSGLTLLDPGDATHRSSLSKTHQFVVDNFSRVDLAPASLLRSGVNGEQLMVLEETDMSKLEEVGFQLPDRFVVKAADGVTDLYGNMWKPFDFDAGRKYPIIVHVYPGPQQEGVSHTFSATSNLQQLAQIGFIVIQVGHRGGTPTRSKAYGRYGYLNMRDYALEDKKSGMEQLAARFPFIDIERVGIFGHSGGGFMSAAALLKPPFNDFFKVAVASSGNHDNNVYNSSWSERYHGLQEVEVEQQTEGQGGRGQRGAGRRGGGRGGQGGGQTEGTGQRNGTGGGTGDGTGDGTGEKNVDQKQDGKQAETGKETRFQIEVPTNAELAANLKGHLLLVHGEMDNNVHPAGTMRLVDALIKANKRFDMLIIPGAAHGFGSAQPYFTRRMWEYFAQHLIGDLPTGTDMPVPPPTPRTREPSRGR